MKPLRRLRKEQSQKRLGYVHRLQPRLELLTMIAGRAKVPMCRFERGAVAHVGCGVLMSLGKDIFIFTALHVLRDFIGHDTYILWKEHSSKLGV